MDQKIPYDDYQLPVVFLPSYENPPAWIPPQEVYHILLVPHCVLQSHTYLFCSTRSKDLKQYVISHNTNLCRLLTLPHNDHRDLVWCLVNFSLWYFQRVHHPDYNNELTQFLPRTIVLKKPPGAQLGFNIRGGKASQLGIFISKVCVCVCVCISLWFGVCYSQVHSLIVSFLKMSTS